MYSKTEQAKVARVGKTYNFKYIIYIHTIKYITLGDMATEIGCGPANMDIHLYKCVTESERKVTTKHERPEWE